jgi:hypothetical protein
MGLLDELQSEVDKIRAREREYDAELEAQEVFYAEHLQQVMLQASDYCSKLVESLQIVAPEVRPAYPLNPLLEEGVILDQSDYSFRCDNHATPRQLDIYCCCTLMEPHEFFLQGKDAVLKHTKVLDSYHFPYHRKNHLDEQHRMSDATFILEGPLKVQIRILACPPDRCIYIELWNVEDQPHKRYRFAPSRLQEELLDRLARVLVREETRLVAVALSDDFRDDLRRRLEHDKRREEEDLAAAYAELEAWKQEEEEAKLINRAKKSLSEGVGRLRGRFSKR